MQSARRKVTFYLDADVLRALRVRAARNDERDSDVVEEALRSFLGLEVLRQVWDRSELDEEEAMALAVSELHAMRREKQKPG